MTYVPGTLRAIGKKKGRAVASYELRTAGRPVKVLLAADRASLAPSWNDAVFVTATVVDASGVPVPGADAVISFRAAGPGMIAAIDNADPASHEPYQGAERHAWQGQAMALVKAKALGQIEVTATSRGLAAGSLRLRAVER
jgi:beta-galactosidase